MANCTDKDFGSQLYNMFCQLNETTIVNNATPTAANYVCDEYFEKNTPRKIQGIQGLARGIFKDNVASKFHDAGDAISLDEENEPEYNLGGLPKMGYVTTDIYTSFTLLVGIFFPSCTGT